MKGAETQMLDFVVSRVTPAGNALLKERGSSRELCLCSVCPASVTDAERPSKGQKSSHSQLSQKATREQPHLFLSGSVRTLHLVINSTSISS